MEADFVDNIKQCGNCQHWQPMGAATGECRLNPPYLIWDAEDEDESVSASWPPTDAGEWCSRFEAKVPVVIEEQITQAGLPKEGKQNENTTT